MADFTELSKRYSGRWKIFQYLTGQGMSIYNEFKYGMSVDTYMKLFEYLLRRDGIDAKRDVELPMYWADEPIDATCKVDLLVNNNLMVCMYSIDAITDEQRSKLVNQMRLTHVNFGYLCNFSREIYYSEWFVRDADTNVVDKVKLVH